MPDKGARDGPRGRFQIVISAECDLCGFTAAIDVTFDRIRTYGLRQAERVICDHIVFQHGVENACFETVTPAPEC